MPFIPNLRPGILVGTLAQLPSGTALAKLPVGTQFRTTDGSSTFTVNVSAGVKSWLNSGSAGTSQHGVVAVSTSNIASLSGLAQTIDGVAISVAGQRVLLVGQTTGSQNGVWVSASGAWTRPTDWYTGDVVNGGSVVNVAFGGTTWGGSEWKTANSGFTIGSSTVTFIPRIVKGTQLLDGGGNATIASLRVYTTAVATATDTSAAPAAVRVQLTASTGGDAADGQLVFTGTAAHTIAYVINNW